MLNNKQYDAQWANKSYAGETYAVAGCGPTSVSDLAEITPPEAGAYLTSIGGAVSGYGTDWNSITAALKHYGFEAIQYNTSNLYGTKNSEAEQKWLANMKAGHQGILLFGPGVFTSGGHFVAIREVNSKNQINVYDPASAARDGWHTVSDWRGAVKVFYSVAPKASEGYTFSPATISYGDYNNSVLLAQELLKVLGYYSLKLDKSAGYGTLAAVGSYQSHVGLTADKICGVLTWTKLLQGIPGSNGTFTLKQIENGYNGSEALVLQMILKARGYYTGTLDASFGDQTEKAVRTAQGALGVNVDGIVGTQTWKALINI